MANYTGCYTEDVEYQWYYDTSPFFYHVGWGRNYGRFYGTLVIARLGAGEAWDDVEVFLAGTHTNNLPVSMPIDAFSGCLAPTLSDVFYNRLLIEPAQIDFGIVVTEQNRDITVWNGYFDTDITLDDILESGFDGLELSGETPPTVYSPLQERTYTLTAYLDGPPNIDAQLRFDWETGYDDNYVYITGIRIVMFPYMYQPNTVESMEWLTKIITHDDGSEVRSSIRNKPRQRFAIHSFVPSTDHARADNMFYGWRDQIWGIPHWGEARKVTSAVTAGDQIIYVDTRYGDFRADSLAVIWENERVYDLFEIASFTDTQINIDREITYDFSVNAYVAPVRMGRLLRDPSRSSTAYTDSLNINFEVNDNVRLEDSASPIVYNGYDTYLEEVFKPGGKNFREEYTKDIRVVDFDTGGVIFYSPWTNTKLSREFLIILEGLQEIWEFREWLHRRRGRTRPFYMPTYENNMRVAGSGNIGLSFTIYDDENDNLGLDRNHIYIRMKDGTEYLREVLSVTDAGGGLLNVAINVSISEDKDDVDLISYMGLKRLSSDRVQFKWLANNIVQCRIPILEIEP